MECVYQAGSHKNTVPVACGLRYRSYVPAFRMRLLGRRLICIDCVHLSMLSNVTAQRPERLQHQDKKKTRPSFGLRQGATPFFLFPS